MPSPSRRTLTTIATVSALAAGGAAFASAATKTTPSSSSSVILERSDVRAVADRPATGTVTAAAAECAMRP